MGAGKALAQRCWAVLWSLDGGLDYVLKTQGLPNFNSNSQCGFCMCNASTLPWRSFRCDAGWIETIWSVNDWTYAGDRYNPMEGVIIHTVGPDWMHVKSWSGVE